MRFMLALIATSTLAAASALAGDEPGWFVGAGAGYFTVDANGFDGSDTSVLGISYGFPSNLGVRAEYQRLDIENSDTVDLAALSLTWRF